MTRVSQEYVLKRWLELEVQKPDVPTMDVSSLSEQEALDELLNAKPGAASFVWRKAPIEWRRLTLSRDAFEGLRVIDGPETLSWRALSPDDTILGAARRISAGDIAILESETGVDVRRVRAFSENPSDDPLVLIDHRDCLPPRVADGNYRATARALRMLELGSYDTVRAYLGVPSKSLLESIRESVCDLVRRRRGRTW
ncbi:hypothetical protein [Haladaptatus caseinilyticus]|uniref:hypothetical protein n=1 Tax=Haladaptatus caseinilyticus TaxID=2993314 RepID=UPI00224B356C|nr:hypothetical protein [Haladaptatus caseinilyticus]